MTTNTKRRAKPFFALHGPNLPDAAGFAIIAACFVVTAVGMAIAWDGTVPGWERTILEFFNGWPDWLEPVMWFLQQPGVLLFPVGAGLVIALATKRGHYAIPFVLLPIYKLIVEKSIVKELVDRTRPATSVGPGINPRGSAHLDEPSFPSGHTTTAVATGLLIAAFLPARWRPLPIVWGGIVGIARLYYGEHNLLDVVAGSALGIAFATVMYLVLLNPWIEGRSRWIPTLAQR